MASRILLAFLLISTLTFTACGSVHAGNTNSTTPVVGSGPNGNQPTITVEWKVLKTDKRFTAIGSAHQDCNPGCNGVPAATGFFLPDFPLENRSFCVDTLNIGTKQPNTARTSFLVLSVDPPNEFGKPSISLRSDIETFHVPEGICFPNEFIEKPTLWMANNWDTPQVMTFVISGTLR